jgi:hypothetical protein
MATAAVDTLMRARAQAGDQQRQRVNGSERRTSSVSGSEEVSSAQAAALVMQRDNADLISKQLSNGGVTVAVTDSSTSRFPTLPSSSSGSNETSFGHVPNAQTSRSGLSPSSAARKNKSQSSSVPNLPTAVVQQRDLEREAGSNGHVAMASARSVSAGRRPHAPARGGASTHDTANLPVQHAVQQRYATEEVAIHNEQAGSLPGTVGVGGPTPRGLGVDEGRGSHQVRHIYISDC